MLNLIKTQLEFCNAPIDDMLSYLKEKRELSYLSFIERCGELCCMGEQFPIAWKTSIDESKQLSALKKEDADILYSLGNALGTTDLNGQLSICDFHINAVKDKMVHARENFKTYAKVYSTMGVLIGAALGVILI
jgi:stage III sporulation protein AB